MIDTLCAGAERGIKSGVTEKVSTPSRERYTTEELSFFYPIALGKIGGLPDAALKSRCLVIEMHPATDAEAAKLYRESRGGGDPAVRAMLAKVLAGHGEELGQMRPDMPPGFKNRRRDRWLPLFAIADAAGGVWPERARAAALELDDPAEDPEADHVAVLWDVVEAVEGWAHDVIFTSELLQRMGDRAPANDMALAALLRPLGVKPSNPRRNGERKRGYRLADIRRAAERYRVQEVAD